MAEEESSSPPFLGSLGLEHLFPIFSWSLCLSFPVHSSPPHWRLLAHSWESLWPSQAISQVALVDKNLSAKAGDLRDAGLLPRWERSPGGGHGNPLQYPCLENPKDRGAWWATVHGVAKTLTWLSMHRCFPWGRRKLRIGTPYSLTSQSHTLVLRKCPTTKAVLIVQFLPGCPGACFSHLCRFHCLPDGGR